MQRKDLEERIELIKGEMEQGNNALKALQADAQNYQNKMNTIVQQLQALSGAFQEANFWLSKMPVENPEAVAPVEVAV